MAQPGEGQSEVGVGKPESESKVSEEWCRECESIERVEDIA